MAAPLLDLAFRSDPAQIAGVRKQAEALAERLGFSEAQRDNLGLVINEALANIIRHAYAGKADGPIALRVFWADPELRIELRDWGNGVNPDTLRLPERDPSTPGGLGLICMRKLMDQAVFSPQADGMLLTLVCRCNGTAKDSQACSSRRTDGDAR